MKTIRLFALTLIMALSACSPFMITNSSGEQPEPVIATDPAATQPAEAVGEPASVNAPTNGYEPVKIDDVTVEVGTGSPIPAFVNVGGNLPDSCAQVEYVKTIQDGSTFKVTVGTTPSDAEGCVQDTLPFRMSIPLNILDLPVGEYAVEVNGVLGDFKVENSSSTGELRTPEMPTYMDDVKVSDVSVEVGVGSPIPVHAVVSAELPKSCGQLGEIQFKRDGNTFFVRLTAELPAQTDCNNDSLPMRIEIPLNIVNLPEGTYEVNVNGATTTFDIPVQ